MGAQEISETIRRARAAVQESARELSSRYQDVHSSIQSLQDAGELTEPKLAEFARAGKFDETLVALSLMCGGPVGFGPLPN